MYSTAEKITTVDSLVTTQTRKIINIREQINQECYERGESWHLLNLEQFEFDIREQERQEIMERQRKRRRERQIKAAERKKHMRIMCVQRFSGLGLIAGTIVAGIIIGNVTFGAITIPVGLLLLFSRDCCLVRRKKNIK